MSTSTMRNAKDGGGQGVPGGPRRKSVLADRLDLPAISARERVASILRSHDDPAVVERLTDSDQPTIRLLAQESAAFGAEPAIRYGAIAALARRPEMENINLLTDLARFGEDCYVRGHALLGLGRLGSYAHLPVIAAGLDAADPFEKAAAAKALVAVAATARPGALDAHASVLGGAALVARVRETLELAGAARRRPETPTVTGADAK